MVSHKNKEGARLTARSLCEHVYVATCYKRRQMAENWTNLRMRKKLWKRLEKEAELEHRSVASLVEKLLSDVITSIEEQRKVG